MATVRTVGVDRVSRLLITMARIDTVPGAIAVPSWIGLHTSVSCAGRSTDRPAHAVTGVDIAVSGSLPAAVIAADL
jgi:hypothetical protein